MTYIGDTPYENVPLDSTQVSYLKAALLAYETCDDNWLGINRTNDQVRKHQFLGHTALQTELVHQMTRYLLYMNTLLTMLDSTKDKVNATIIKNLIKWIEKGDEWATVQFPTRNRTWMSNQIERAYLTQQSFL